MRVIRERSCAGRLTHRGLLVGLLLGALGAVAPAAGAATASSLSVRVLTAAGTHAPNLKVNANPGRTTAAGRVLVINAGTAAVTVRVDAVNGLTADTLGWSYAPTTQVRRAAARWLRIGARSFVVRAHATQTIDVRLAVPRATPPGMSLAGIAVQTVAPTAPAYDSVTGVEVTVPGTLTPQLRFTGARVVQTAGGLEFLIAAENTGNEIVAGVHGTVSVSMGGHRVVSSVIRPGTFVTDSHIEYPLPAPKEHPHAGERYLVEASLIYAGHLAMLDTNVPAPGATSAPTSATTTVTTAAGTTSAVSVRPSSPAPPPVPTATSSSKTPAWHLIAIIAAGALLLLLVLTRVIVARRRRAPAYAGIVVGDGGAPLLTMDETVRTLQTSLTEARARGGTLSILSVAATIGAPTTERVEAVLHEAVRPADRIGRVGDRLVIILSDASDFLAHAFAVDISERLGRAGVPPPPGAVGVAVDDGSIGPLAFIERAGRVVADPYDPGPV